ncbi:MAG: peptidoglycan recognition family protein [Lachnospiraceae bacterium]|nr:peptidoglycan recognition family protein [Lachnospiraceae bacterium]
MAPVNEQTYEEQRRERQRLRRERKEYERWRFAHRIVRILIVIVLILDVIIFRFGIFKGGFLPVWNMLTSGGTTTASTETTVSSGIDLEISEQLLTVNEYSRPGTELTAVNGIVVHYIGNPGTDAQANRDYFESLKDGSSEVYSSCNYIIGLDGTIIQCVPDNEVAYASGERNSDTISIECCHPDETGAFTEETYNSLVLLTAKLCSEYSLTTDQILRHYDVNGKPCPLYFVNDADAWSSFLSSVAAQLQS